MFRPLKFACLLTTVGLWSVGCQQQAPAPTPTTTPNSAATPAATTDDHGPGGHSHAGEGGHGAGPHGGTIADWGGGKFHVEFTVDHEQKSATVYVLGSDEKTPAPVKTPDGTLLLTINEPSFQVTMQAAPLDGETNGTASRFTGTHDSLGVVREFAGSMSAEVDGTPYAGDFAEAAHGEHGHAHGHTHGADDALVWEGEPKSHAGTTILIGHHAKVLHAGAEVEPAVSIMRDGKAVADAKVFNSLLSEDGQSVLAKEMPTVYEPESADEPAHYAQGGLMIPKDIKKVVIRFRIEIPGTDSVEFDAPVAVE